MKQPADPRKNSEKKNAHGSTPAPKHAGTAVKKMTVPVSHPIGGNWKPPAPAAIRGDTKPGVTSPAGSPANAYGNTAALIASPTIGDVYVITIVNTKVGGKKVDDKPPTVYLNTPDGSSVSAITPQTRLPQGLPSLDKLLGGLIPSGMIPKGAIPEAAASSGAILAGKPPAGTGAGSQGGKPGRDGAKSIGNSALDIGSPTVGDVYVISIVNTKKGESGAEGRE